jgi:hypothetical protein
LSLNLRSTIASLLAPTVIVVAGCGGRVSASDANAANGLSGLSIHAAATRIDTNRTTRLTATLADGEPANVQWSVSGGDPTAGAGSISPDGLYTPPSYLTQDAVTIEVNAALAGSQGEAAPAAEAAALTVTPGFLQPLTPGNLSLGPGGTVVISGSTDRSRGQRRHPVHAGQRSSRYVRQSRRDAWRAERSALRSRLG